MLAHHDTRDHHDLEEAGREIVRWEWPHGIDGVRIVPSSPD